MGTPLASREAQTEEVIERLYKEYPDTTISLNFSNRLELLVAVNLFEKYQSVEDYAEADEAELAEDLNSITYYNNKAGYIKNACQQMLDDHDGNVPDTMSALTDLHGVGRKTANVVLQHGHEVVEGIVVDTHVQRLTRRLGITEEERPEAIEEALMPLVPEADWQQFTHLLISHGRAACTARNPDCADCVLEDVCPSSKLDSDTDLASGEAW